MRQKAIPRLWSHRLWARPMLISWVIGTLAIWLPMTYSFISAGAMQSVVQDWTMPLMLLVFYAATSGFGFFIGAFFVLWAVEVFCNRRNGAPHEIGESVVILSGRYSGQSSKIYEITTGQGGEPLARVDLGPEAREQFLDIFPEYQLLRLSPRRPA